ncbi:hypothetical protein [Musicola paradisiaca]|uniref:Uncharacterized protein n=1 Tax=Musicola paradisiaca (strain Ech703) TaxID=579405 RepID=C6CBJ4_MUSP7|nr:hypothetical protein [Musicola paradisiaca]ACS84779.1 hypothetical protein Dd703_0973 [Musicola paradisiaca Ech703]
MGIVSAAGINVMAFTKKWRFTPEKGTGRRDEGAQRGKSGIGIK